MTHLDEHMQNWSAELSAGLKIVPPESDHLASIIEGEVMALSSEAKLTR